MSPSEICSLSLYIILVGAVVFFLETLIRFLIASLFHIALILYKVKRVEFLLLILSKVTIVLRYFLNKEVNCSFRTGSFSLFRRLHKSSRTDIDLRIPRVTKGICSSLISVSICVDKGPCN